MTLQYVTNTEGVPVAVQIPLLEWEKLMQELGELRRKIEVLQGIKEGIIEVRKARKEKRKLQTLTDFLNEC
jgi:hypothetical protein